MSSSSMQNTSLDPVSEMRLMAACRRISFRILASAGGLLWLGVGRIVIAPHPWFRARVPGPDLARIG